MTLFKTLGFQISSAWHHCVHDCTLFRIIKLGRRTKTGTLQSFRNPLFCFCFLNTCFESCMPAREANSSLHRPPFSPLPTLRVLQTRYSQTIFFAQRPKKLRTDSGIWTKPSSERNSSNAPRRAAPHSPETRERYPTRIAFKIWSRHRSPALILPVDSLFSLFPLAFQPKKKRRLLYQASSCDGLEQTLLAIPVSPEPWTGSRTRVTRNKLQVTRY